MALFSAVAMYNEPMQFIRTNLAGCAQVTGLAVVIDVLRAFTTAGYLFAAGVERILLVSGVDEALDLHQRFPGSLLLGEIDGIPIQGFDLGNSPAQLPPEGLAGKTIVQRTTAGTQGVVLATRAEPMLTAGLTNAGATARAIRRLAPATVTFIQTGQFLEEGWGDEDVACADLIEARLRDLPVDPAAIAARVRQSRSGLHYDGTRPAFPPADLELALRFDCFDFAMLVTKKDGLHILQAVHA